MLRKSTQRRGGSSWNAWSSPVDVGLFDSAYSTTIINCNFIPRNAQMEPHEVSLSRIFDSSRGLSLRSVAAHSLRRGILPRHPLCQRLQQLRQEGSTSVLITHKTNILATVDKILVLSRGEVAGFGSRDEILSKLLGPRLAPVPASAASA